MIYGDKGDQIQALEYHLQALPILQEIGDRLGEATTLSNIGLLFSQADDGDTALEYYEQSLQLTRETGNPMGEATTLNNIGLVFENKGDKTIALDYFRQSLALSEIVGDRAGSALTLFNIASLEDQLGNTRTALTTIEKALDIIEDLRTKVASPTLRQSYFSTVQNYYNLRIRLLMQLHQQDPSQNYDGQAFSVSEKSRARTLIDLLTEANTDIREGISPELLATEEKLLQTLDDIEQVRLVIYNNIFSKESEKAEVDRNLAIANANYRDFQDQIRKESPQYADLKYPEPLTVEELQAQVLDEDTVLLQYAIGEQKSYLWVITNDGLSSYELPKAKVLNKAIEEVRGYITGMKTGLPEPLQRREDQNRLNAINQLSELILAPAVEQLKKKRLLIVADGNLHFLPFSVLNLSGLEYHPLSDRHEIVNLPSASTISILRQNTIDPIPSNASLAILADPVFHEDDCRIESDDPNCFDPQPEFKLDPRPDEDLNFLALKRATKNFNNVDWDRLLGTRTEAQSILNLLPKTNKTLQAFDFDADRELMTGDRLQDYDLIHIATHGFLNTEIPELSGLVLSLVDKEEHPQNGFLRINDVFNLKLNADLIVLSACQTGLGDQVQGEGLVGLSRGFMYAGVPRIVVSLWQVDDAATAEFMTRFYRLLLRENLTPAAALKQTQQEMRTETKWTHPYYWAAFILQGEWR
ncbi:MAG: CHAT domain-containing protein [Limnothrix sp. RL_2_0]|nr:CHAT domain-containing protein [Limnothrix sp. RL_2_0]